MKGTIRVKQVALGFLAGLVVAIFAWDPLVSISTIYTDVCNDTLAISDRDFGVLAASHAYYSVDDPVDTEVRDVKHFDPVPGSPLGYAKVAVIVHRYGGKEDRYAIVSVNSCGLIIDNQWIEGS